MSSRWLVLALSWMALPSATLRSSYLPPQYLPIYGGGGGSGYTRSCGAGKVLTGLTGRTGLLLDAVGVLCRPVSSTGVLGSESTVGTLVGGAGGTSGSAKCSTGKVVSSARIWHGMYVHGVAVSCQAWSTQTRSFSGPSESHVLGNGTQTALTSSTESCEAPTQPANGIRGRAHSLVDAVGFICNEP